MINKQTLYSYITDTKNPLKCYHLAQDYYKVQHYAEAVSFFLKAAENSEGDLRYDSLLHVHFCYRELGGRNFTLNSILKQLIALYPDRPEAYYHLAKVCEKESAFMDGYMWSNMGLSRIKNKSKSFSDLELNDAAELLFLKAHFAWYVDKPREARATYQYILKNHLLHLDQSQKTFLQSKLLELGMAPQYETVKLYNKENKHNWIYSFEGIEQIQHNHSQILQDMFVLYCLNGKRNGTYLEVGSAYPYYTNNTALLEEFGWVGVGLDNNTDFVQNYNEYRKNKSILTDALTTDYKQLIHQYCGGVRDIDYLQLDIKTPEDTYTCLTKIPFDEHRFAVITYEHDDYVDITQTFKQKSREYLWSKGYVLAIPDVAPIDGYSFEDWWIHPELVDMNRIWSMNRIASIEWGDLPSDDRATIYKDVQIERVYKYWATPQDGDVVVDIGANVGAFSVSVLDKKLKHLHVVECSKKYMDLCIKNIGAFNSQNSPVSFYNQAIVKNRLSKINLLEENDIIGEPVSFKDFVKDNEIHYIDFLKIDAEGAEYNIFTEENIEFLKNNVKFIAAEFHLTYDGNREQWKRFRDKYLSLFPHYQILSCKTQDIVPGNIIDLSNYLANDNFVDDYNHPFMVYISNDRTKL